MSASRKTALFDEHLALGADMESYAWAGMAMPWTYRTTLAEEQRAVRQHVGLADVSQLNVVRLAGAGAADCLERLLPSPIGDMPVGSTRFSTVLSRFGKVSDEALVMRVDDDEFWISHGCGNARSRLLKLATGHGVQVDPREDMHVLSLQGPGSAALLAPLHERVAEPLAHLHNRRTAIAGRSVLLSRSGFTGEPGFEIFCERDDAVPLWRTLMDAGQPQGLRAYSYRCVDLLRIEAGFPLYPTDLALCSSIWEAGLGWMVRRKQADFVGRAAVEEARSKARFRFVGARVAGEVDLRPEAGSDARSPTKVYLGSEEVGLVSSSAYSPAADETLCIVRIRRDAFTEGREVSVRGALERSAIVTALPFRPRRTESAAGYARENVG